MVFNKLSDKAKLRRHRTNEAIALAMQARWEEAIAVNKSIIELFPDDADAYNRLGKAFTQTGNYVEAKGAYGQALEIDPDNAIAKKNLERLSYVKTSNAERKQRKQVSSHIFIGETGKSDIAYLIELAPQEVLAKMTTGDPIVLKREKQRLIVETENGQYLGEVEPKIGLRLVKLIEGGNKYLGAIASLAENATKVIIREIYQDPSQIGKPSFPTRATDEFRSYVKDSMLKYELEDEEEPYDDDSSDEWELSKDLTRKHHSDYETEQEFTDTENISSDDSIGSDIED